jgi:NAD(P) transhydrogenase subunit alpha
LYFAVPAERIEGERRVALVPDGVKQRVGRGHKVGVQAGAGLPSGALDEEYAAAGGEVVAEAEDLYGRADAVVKVRAPDADELHLLRSGVVLVALLAPLAAPELADQLGGLGAVAFSLDAVPRIARAQSMDVLSSMSNVGGYRAALAGAVQCGRFFPLMMTAAGTIPPAKVLIIGAGVAGLQAIATAKRLGAVVQAFDTREATRQQVESLGASFLTLPLPAGGAEGAGGYARRLASEEEALERELLADPVRQADVVITTALVPGMRAPVLITAEMVAAMHPGAVIVDMAAEAGGNTAVTVPGQQAVVNGVVIDGTLNWPSAMPQASSRLFSRNVVTFLRHLLDSGLAEGTVTDSTDEIVRGTLITHGGHVVHAATLERLAARTGGR